MFLAGLTRHYISLCSFLLLESSDPSRLRINKTTALQELGQSFLQRFAELAQIHFHIFSDVHAKRAAAAFG